MEYERIDKVQTGVISPTKLRLKLLGGNLGRRSSGSSNSTRTSPSRIKDMEFTKDGLLESDAAYLDDALNFDGPESASATCFNMPNSVRRFVSSGQDEQSGKKHNKEFNIKGKDDDKCIRSQDDCQDFPDNGVGFDHPTRSVEESMSDSDGKQDGGSNSIFEFHRVERVLPSPALGPFSRPLPSKWDDAEKWIINRQKSLPKNCDALGQLNRGKVGNWVRVAPEAVIPEARVSSLSQAGDCKRSNLYQSSSQSVVEKFSCPRLLQFSKGPNGTTYSASTSCESVYTNEQKEVREVDLALPDRGITPVKSVCMRDMGTEMTPGTSQEPSRMGTPLEATTPIRSFNSSRESTPRRGSPTPTPVKLNPLDKKACGEKGVVNGLSKEEFRIKTRREIVALGVKLGKMNIAAWASKEGLENACSSSPKHADDDLDKVEFEARASSWEEAEKSKYMARYRRAEVSIQAWESQQKVKYEAKLREVEVELELKRAAAQEKITRKLVGTKLQCEKKLAAAEARKGRRAARTAKQADRIRRTGNRPLPHLLCCSIFL